MIYSLSVPGTIEDVTEVRVLEWHRGMGDAFDAGDLLVELETHKVVIEVRAGKSGVLRMIICAAGDWQKIGHGLALLSDTAAERLPDPADATDPMPVAFEIV
jgi:pyruvate/2-oxoglutarate dehydrogenase complex dihydrolipoamide acyltransferase (E2) component